MPGLGCGHVAVADTRRPWTRGDGGHAAMVDTRQWWTRSVCGETELRTLGLVLPAPYPWSCLFVATTRRPRDETPASPHRQFAVRGIDRMMRLVSVACL